MKDYLDKLAEELGTWRTLGDTVVRRSRPSFDGCRI